MNNLLAHAIEGARLLVHRPLRSALTAATCAVAIAVTVNVVSLSYGMDEDIRGDIRRFGRLTIDVARSPLIRPGAPRPALGAAERAGIESLLAPLGAVLVPMKQATVSATGAATVARQAVAAVGIEYPRTLAIGVVAGRWLEPSDRGSAVCVLDASVAAELWPGVPPAAVVGRTLSLSGDPPRSPAVVGILQDPFTYRKLFEIFDETRGARTQTSSLLTFKNVYLPLDAIPGDDLTRVSVVLPDERAVDRAEALLTSIPEWTTDLSTGILVFVRKDWMDALGDTTQMGAMFSNLLWIIVVVVAGIMIATLNLTTIRERYDELAIRRCEGARKRDVAMQVTAEGVLTALVGGLAGLPLGYLGAGLLRRIVDFPFRFEARYAVFATAVAAAIGLLTSVFPARRAAGIDPARVLSRRLT